MTISRPARLPVLIAALLLAPCFGEQPKPYLQAKPEALQWWRDAKFGVFICWGPVSIAGTEIGWSRRGPRPGHRSKEARSGVPVETYDSLYKKFNPTEFDAKEWVDVIKDAGARYMIFLTKHHDGFCLFHTKHTDYSIANSPFKRDVTGELAKACQEAGIRIFWYYSQPDWHHPDYRTENHARYIEFLHGQIRELCTTYGKIDGIWFDGLGGRAKDWDSERLFKMIRELQPHALINNRGGFPGDFYTPEQHVGRFDIERPWESCITMAGGWSWRPKTRVRSLKECLHLLIRCAGGGGNLALDTGPMPDGRINPEQAQRYRDMGAWLRKYGDSIYGTTGGPYKPSDWWGVSTRKGNKVFLHVLHWDGDLLELPNLPRRVLHCTALTGGTPTLEQKDTGLAIRLPQEGHDPIDTIIVLELDGPSLDIRPISILPPGCVSAKKPCSASGIWSKDYSAAMAFDGDKSTRWGAKPGARSGWLSVDLGEPTTFDRVVILEAPWNRVQKFQLQCREGDEWRTFHEGTKLGNFRLRFEPVAAQHVRLNVLEATDVPTIWEVQFFAAAEQP